MDAIYATLDARPDLCRPLPAKGGDSDREFISQALLSWAVLGTRLPDVESEGSFSFPDRALFKGSGLPDEVVVAHRGVSSTQVFTLPGWTVDILDEPALQNWAEVYDDYLYFHFDKFCSYNLPAEVRGSPLEAVASTWLYMNWKMAHNSDVYAYMSGGGVKTRWVREDGSWRLIGVSSVLRI